MPLGANSFPYRPSWHITCCFPPPSFPTVASLVHNQELGDSPQFACEVASRHHLSVRLGCQLLVRRWLPSPFITGSSRCRALDFAFCRPTWLQGSGVCRELIQPSHATPPFSRGDILKETTFGCRGRGACLSRMRGTVC